MSRVPSFVKWMPDRSALVRKAETETEWISVDNICRNCLSYSWAEPKGKNPKPPCNLRLHVWWTMTVNDHVVELQSEWEPQQLLEIAWTSSSCTPFLPCYSVAASASYKSANRSSRDEPNTTANWLVALTFSPSSLHHQVTKIDNKSNWGLQMNWKSSSLTRRWKTISHSGWAAFT